MADDKLTYTAVPDIIDYYLGEKPMLAERGTCSAAGSTRSAEVLIASTSW